MILQAAERVVAASGAPSLSFEAVAREAGVSKGAVLHYFGTKEALVGAMVARLVARLAPRAEGPSPPGTADLRRSIERAHAAHGGRDASASALLAALAQDLAALAPLRAANRAWLDHLAPTLGPFRAQLLHFALDGLWTSEVLGISPLSEAERDAFFRGLLQAFSEAGSAPAGSGPVP
jgi:AcrR family transcriptional regulator